jgi:hypothetical protein
MSVRNHLFAFSLLFLLVAFPLHSKPQPLEPFEWEHRLILIRGTVDGRSGIKNSLMERRAAIEERHILWFLFAGDLVETNFDGSLPGDFAAKIDQAGYWQDAETVLLIGKDGGVKARQATLDLEALFRDIDSMPMRRAEMRQQG